MLLEFQNDETGARLVFEDDEKTGYAYLIIDNAMVGDVWLYNVEAAPEKPEWTNPDNMPFANSTAYASSEPFASIAEPREIAVEWHCSQSEVLSVVIFLRGRKHAELRPGEKPGWCRLATRNGPLAKVLDEAS